MCVFSAQCGSKWRYFGPCCEVANPPEAARPVWKSTRDDHREDGLESSGGRSKVRFRMNYHGDMFSICLLCDQVEINYKYFQTPTYFLKDISTFLQTAISLI